MSRKQALLRGTFILTATGIATRLMGFFYRIFLSRTFHAEGVGLYQLIFPVYALCFSFTAAGIQVALSRIVASRISLHQEREAVLTLRVSLFLTVILSAAATLFLQHNARWIASELLSDKRCADLLVAMSWSFPFAAVHSCICGYYFGKKQTKVPAISQLLEQFVRIFSVWFFYKIGLHYSSEVHITIAVFGLVCGEVAAAAYSAWMLKRTIAEHRGRFMEYFRPAGELLRLSVPLTANRVLLNVLQSVEAVSIPLRLQSHGHTLSESLSIYGVLTGMALPCIMFPSAITNSVSTMLLPTVAEIQATADRKKIKKLVQKVIIKISSEGNYILLHFRHLLYARFLYIRKLDWNRYLSQPRSREVHSYHVVHLPVPLHEHYADQHHQRSGQDYNLLLHQYVWASGAHRKRILPDTHVWYSGLPVGNAGKPAGSDCVGNGCPRQIS